MVLGRQKGVRLGKETSRIPGSYPDPDPRDTSLRRTKDTRKERLVRAPKSASTRSLTVFWFTSLTAAVEMDFVHASGFIMLQSCARATGDYRSVCPKDINTTPFQELLRLVFI